MDAVKATGYIVIITIVTIGLLVMSTSGLLAIPWWVVLAPLYLPPIIAIVIMFCILFMRAVEGTLRPIPPPSTHDHD